MRAYLGLVRELCTDHMGLPTVWIACPPGAIPAAGQYLKAHAPGVVGASLPTILFAAESSAEGFRAVPPVPIEWLPGTALSLSGPLGNGFTLDTKVHRLALVALEDVSRLVYLIPQALEQRMDVTLFTDSPAPVLSASVEVSPLSALPEALTWADLLAMDVPLRDLAGLRLTLGIKPGHSLPCPAQVLVTVPMPCAGLADCGVCAVPSRRGLKLACQDGPVFALGDLDW